jgi:hypothetical protein
MQQTFWTIQMFSSKKHHNCPAWTCCASINSIFFKCMIKIKLLLYDTKNRKTLLLGSKKLMLLLGSKSINKNKILFVIIMFLQNHFLKKFFFFYREKSNTCKSIKCIARTNASLEHM